MARFKADEYVAQEMYLRRPKLREHEAIAVRVRVAIKCVDRLYNRLQWIVAERDFPDYAVRLLDKMIVQRRGHPLDEEIRDVLSGWKRGEIYAQVYYRAATLQAKRVIGQVRYGGRRG